jgi:hypothetical protein
VVYLDITSVSRDNLHVRMYCCHPSAFAKGMAVRVVRLMGEEYTGMGRPFKPRNSDSKCAPKRFAWRRVHRNEKKKRCMEK